MALILLTALVGASRIAALPGSLWHQDEAEFAASVLDFDVTWNRPHPPWFPLWIVIGKAAHAAGLPADRALQIPSALLSTASLIPLFLFWSVWLRRELALAAAVLFLLLPGVWLLSGRAFSDTPGLALLAAALACWLDPGAQRRTIAAGSLFAGLDLLVRPQHVALLAGPLIVAWRRGADRRALVGPMLLLGAAGAAGLLLWGGGPKTLFEAARLLGWYQREILAAGGTGFADAGLARILVAPWAAGLWLVLAAAGALPVARRGRRGAGAMLAGALAPAAAVLVVLFDPVEPRYWLPFVALTSGLVVVAAAHGLRRWSLAVVAAAVAGSAWVVVPDLATYRSEVSPPLRALAEASRQAASGGRTVVADLNLFPFAELRRLSGRPSPTVLYDVELAKSGPPPPGSAVAVYTDDQDAFVTAGGAPLTFRCETPAVRRLEPGPYLEATVVPAARVRPAPRRPGRR